MLQFSRQARVIRRFNTNDNLFLNEPREDTTNGLRESRRHWICRPGLEVRGELHLAGLPLQRDRGVGPRCPRVIGRLAIVISGPEAQRILINSDLGIFRRRRAAPAIGLAIDVAIRKGR